MREAFVFLSMSHVIAILKVVEPNLENSPYVNSIFILKHATPAVDMSSNKCNFFYFKDSRNVISSICNKVLLMPFRRLVTRIQWNNSAAVRKCSFSAIGIFLLHVIEYINTVLYLLTYVLLEIEEKIA